MRNTSYLPRVLQSAQFPEAPVRAIGLAACLLYAFFELSLPDTGKYAEAVLILLTLVALCRGERAPQLLAPLVMLGAAIAVSATAWLASFASREYGFDPDSAPRIDQVGKWFLFMVPAFWLGKNRSGPPLFWAAAVLGLVALPWISGDGLKEFSQALDNRRIDAGTMNAQHAAMLSGLAFILSICLIIQNHMQARWLIVSRLIGTLLFAGSLFLLYATQTRGVWLGCSAAAVAMLLAALARSRVKPARNSTGIGVATGMTVALLIAGTLWTAANSNAVNRLEHEADTIGLAMAGEINKLPPDSVGVRLRSWYHALPWLEERFWFGWGPDGSKLIMQESDALPSGLKSQFGHLHNSYLDIMAQFGFAGLLLYLVLLAWFARYLVRAYRDRRIPYGAYLFGIGFLTYWLVVNLFESYMLFSSGEYAFTVVLAGLISLARPEPKSVHGAPNA